VRSTTMAMPWPPPLYSLALSILDDAGEAEGADKETLPKRVRITRRA
jgi:hypothetical protein